jgi:ssDNA-binding Zn-finger/Zn-ribbon topoisomerase 1
VKCGVAMKKCPKCNYELSIILSDTIGCDDKYVYCRRCFWTEGETMSLEEPPRLNKISLKELREMDLSVNCPNLEGLPDTLDPFKYHECLKKQYEKKYVPLDLAIEREDYFLDLIDKEIDNLADEKGFRNIIRLMRQSR